MDTVASDTMKSNNGTSRSFDKDVLELQYQHAIRNPIVYTTKLDEMMIFKDCTTDLSVKTFINSIIKESKPKFNIFKKRKRSVPVPSHNSYEDLSCHVNTFNRKVARIAGANCRLLSMCKPVKIVLEDIQYTLHTQSTESGNSKSVNKKRPTHSGTLKCALIYDKQHAEADMYSLDRTYIIKEHQKFRIDKGNENILHSLRKDNNFSEITCCCWYAREKFLKSLTLLPLETLRFMRKPHKCAINLCRCCCRKILEPVSKDTSSIRPSSQKPSESLTDWLKKITKMHASLPISDISRNTLLSKSVRSVQKLPKKNNHVKDDDLPFLHSTNIDFGGEYYAIGTDGQIKIHLKKTENDWRSVTKLPKSANNIVGNICCWYKREEFAGRLLALSALPNTVNYIRSTHPCSPTNCSCCCKPSNTKKAKLILFHKGVRHTNDLVSRKVNIKVKFTKPAMRCAVNSSSVKPFVLTKLPTYKRDEIASFNVSLSALEIISKDKNAPYIYDLLIPESGTFEQKDSIRVLMQKIPKFKMLKYKPVIECADLNNFSTNKLKMLDIIFRAIDNATREPDKPKKPDNISSKRRVMKYLDCTYNTIYPLLLNEQLSIATDLRNKRFLASLRAHLGKYNCPREWLKGSTFNHSLTSLPQLE